MPDAKSTITLAILFAFTLVIGGLAARAHGAKRRALSREARTHVMYELTGRLAETSSFEELAAITVQHLAKLLSRPALLLAPDAMGALHGVAASNDAQVSTRELLAARQVWERSGCTEVAASTEALFAAGLLPLFGSKRVGVLVVRSPETRTRVLAIDFELLAICARKAALAMERASRAEAAAAAELATQRERAQDALLRSLAHDFRTPLASILCAGSSLLDHGERLPESSRTELATTVVEESERLNRLLTNVLSMTRLEAIGSTAEQEVQPLDEIVAAALDRVGERLSERPLSFSAPDELLVAADAVLLGQLVTNVVENCLRYTPTGSPIEIVIEARGSQGVLRISDRGPGVAPGREAHLFEKFYRAPTGHVNDGGLGIGLTICSAIAQVHGGRIEAANREGGGLVVSLFLPRAEHDAHVALALATGDANGKGALHA